MVKWLEDDDVLYDVLSAKDVIVEGKQANDIDAGCDGKGKYHGSFFHCQR